MEDLELKNLGQYYGSLNKYKLFMSHTEVTEGIKYLADNGYYWFVSDADIIINMKLRNEEFIAITLRVNEDKTAIVEYTNGNGKKLYERKYNYTNAKVKELKLFYIDNTMLLTGEY